MSLSTSLPILSLKSLRCLEFMVNPRKKILQNPLTCIHISSKAIFLGGGYGNPLPQINSRRRNWPHLKHPHFDIRPTRSILKNEVPPLSLILIQFASSIRPWHHAINIDEHHLSSASKALSKFMQVISRCCSCAWQRNNSLSRRRSSPWGGEFSDVQKTNERRFLQIGPLLGDVSIFWVYLGNTDPPQPSPKRRKPTQKVLNSW